MRITPLDIRKQEFKKSMRGFDPDEVYAFLNTVAEEYEAALSDNKGLREHIVNLKERLDEFKNMEKNLRNTLLTAEKLTADTKENARNEAELILREAEVEAEKLSENIRAHTRQLRREILELKKQKDNYLTRLKTLIDNHRGMIAGFEGDFKQADQEIENLEFKMKKGYSESTPHRRMNRKKITEEFSRKPEEEPAVRDGGVQEVKLAKAEASIGKVDMDVKIGDTSGEKLSDAELSESVTENIEHSLYPEIDENTEKRISEKQNTREGDSVSNKPESKVDVNEGGVDKDEWAGYEVEKKETDWSNYEISSIDRPAENEVEEALSGLTEESEQVLEESLHEDEKDLQHTEQGEYESTEGYSGGKRDESDFQEHGQHETSETESESRDAGERNNNERLEDLPDSAEKPEEENSWSMDRLRENLTNIGKQDS